MPCKFPQALILAMLSYVFVKVNKSNVLEQQGDVSVLQSRSSPAEGSDWFACRLHLPHTEENSDREVFFFPVCFFDWQDLSGSSPTVTTALCLSGTTFLQGWCSTPRTNNERTNKCTWKISSFFTLSIYVQRKGSKIYKYIYVMLVIPWAACPHQPWWPHHRAPVRVGSE